MRRLVAPLVGFAAVAVACAGAAPSALDGVHEDAGADAFGDVRAARDGGSHHPDAASDASRTTPKDATAVLDAHGASDASDASESNADAGDGGATCEVSGAPGTCILTTACASLGDHTSYAGHCPGAADIECCIVTPSTADNPPTPAGYVLMAQADVTAAMTTWAVMILDDPTGYPMFSTTTKVFGTQLVLARVEWHPPDFQNSVVHRGVTLYVPSG